jgi:hypothetical protein
MAEPLRDAEGLKFLYFCGVEQLSNATPQVVPHRNALNQRQRKPKNSRQVRRFFMFHYQLFGCL